MERGKEGEIRIMEEKERTRVREREEGRDTYNGRKIVETVGEREGGRDTYNGRERENKS